MNTQQSALLTHILENVTKSKAVKRSFLAYFSKAKEKTLLLAATLLSSGPAYAGSTGKIETALKGLIDIMTGAVAQSIAVIAVSAVGWSWMTSQISLKTATVIVLGIGIVFGAPEIATLFYN